MGPGSWLDNHSTKFQNTARKLQELQPHKLARNRMCIIDKFRK
jgi:hypothetical protein